MRSGTKGNRLGPTLDSRIRQQKKVTVKLTDTSLISPYGDSIVDLIAPAEEADRLRFRALNCPRFNCLSGRRVIWN
jgi:hypothetical protein